MEIKIKQYEYQKTEINSKVIILPTKPIFYFETHIRRSIRIVPLYTTWQKNRFDKEEEIYELDFTCVYMSSEIKVERFKIRVSQIEEIYYLSDHKHKQIVVALVEDWLDSRTSEQFYSDLNFVLSEITK